MRFKVANYSRLEIRLDTLHIYSQLSTDRLNTDILQKSVKQLFNMVSLGLDNGLQSRSNWSTAQWISQFLTQFSPASADLFFQVVQAGDAVPVNHLLQRTPPVWFSLTKTKTKTKKIIKTKTKLKRKIENDWKRKRKNPKRLNENEEQQTSKRKCKVERANSCSW